MLVPPNPQGDQYNFAAQPKVVQPKSKYRQVTEADGVNGRQIYNLMQDKRVVRGNTYAAIVTTSREATQQLKSTVRAQPKLTNPQLETHEADSQPRNISTPPPMDGRCHFAMMTDEYVEILTDKPPEYEKDTQTEFYIDRPPDRLFMPQKTGEDRETQIWDGDLFDFDYEVEPILQVLMGKTLEQSRMEVLEEEELRTMKQQQKKYDELRSAEISEAQRLEAEEKRQLEENERRKIQYRIKKEQAVTSHKKLISRLMAKEYLKNIKDKVFGKLEDQGVFRDTLEQDLYNIYLPWTFHELVDVLGDQDQVSSLIENVNGELIKFWANEHEKAMDAEKERRRKKKEEEIRKQKEKEEKKRQSEERKRRLELEKRIQELKEKIDDLFMKKAEMKTGVFNLVFSDIDQCGRDIQAVGLLGGLLGELLTLASTLEELKEEESFVHFKSITLNPDALVKLIHIILGEIMKEGAFEIGVSEELEELLLTVDEKFRLDNLHTADAAQKKALETIIKKNIRSAYVNSLNMEEAKINPDVYDHCLTALARVILTDDSSVQKKLKLVKVPKDYATGPKLLGIVKMTPKMEELAFSNWTEAKQQKDKKLDKKRENRAQQKSGSRMNREKSNASLSDDAKGEDSKPSIIDPTEAEFEDKVSVIPVMNEEIRVFVHQYLPTMLLRREILLSLATIYKEIESKEVDILKKVYQKAAAMEKNFVEHSKDFYTFDFESY
jgi:hypothetical protein